MAADELRQALEDFVHGRMTDVELSRWAFLRYADQPELLDARTEAAPDVFLTELLIASSPFEPTFDPAAFTQRARAVLDAVAGRTPWVERVCLVVSGRAANAREGSLLAHLYALGESPDPDAAEVQLEFKATVTGFAMDVSDVRVRASHTA